MTETPDYDAQVRHSIYVERRKARLARDVVRMVNGVTGDLYGMIATSDLDGLTRRQLDRLLREVEYVIRAGYDPIKGTISEQLRDFGIYEADFQTRLVERMGSSVDIGVPSDADIWAAVNSRPFEGKFLTGWLDGLPDNTARRVREAIRQGYVDGRGPLDIAREIRGTRTRRGIMDISARGAEAMVRTAMAHTASMAKEQTYKGRRGIREVQWVSVLDHRTSDICRANDGKIFPKDEGPRPPAHVACRSTVVPVTKGNRKRLQERETYQDWLKRQSEAVQDDILGPSRGKLYREGGYSVSRFVDESGQKYTLDQLRAKDQETFNEVFGE